METTLLNYKLQDKRKIYVHLIKNKNFIFAILWQFLGYKRSSMQCLIKNGTRIPSRNTEPALITTHIYRKEMTRLQSSS